MHRIFGMTLGAVLCTIVSTSALAQTGTKPIVVKKPYPRFEIEGPVSGKPDHLRRYFSVVHARALQGITLTAADSVPLRKPILSQLEEMFEIKRTPLPNASASDVTPEGGITAAGRAKRYEFHSNFYKKRIPELRTALPAAQQATFDQNVQALEKSNYIFVNEAGQPVSHMNYSTNRKK